MAILLETLATYVKMWSVYILSIKRPGYEGEIDDPEQFQFLETIDELCVRSCSRKRRKLKNNLLPTTVLQALAR